MKVIIDSNRVIAAILKDSTRKIIFDDFFEFFAPEYIKSEIDKNHEEIFKKADLTSEAFAILLDLIFENIKIVPEEKYNSFINFAKLEIKDQKDVPYLALCMAINAAGIGSHDPHFKEQQRCHLFTNIDLLRLSDKTENETQIY